jgi:hypothetical protein
VDALLNSMEQHLDIFQRSALAARKREGAQEDPPWLADYLERAHYPTAKDVERLRKMVSKYRALYERAVKPARNKYLAHREKEEHTEVGALFARGTVRELWRLTTFLLQLHEVLWQQLHNGKKPVFRSVRHSVKSIYDTEEHGMEAHELIVADVRRLMRFIEHATLSNAKKARAK